MICRSIDIRGDNMETDSLKNLKILAKSTPIKFLNISGKDKINIVCSECNHSFDLALPTELETITCPNCKEVININIILE